MARLGRPTQPGRTVLEGAPDQRVDRTYHTYYKRQRRLDAITALGGACNECGYDADLRALQIDHVNQDGLLDMLPCGKRYAWKAISLILNGQTDRFQVLCANCHAIKTCEERRRASYRRQAG